jgi:hypothetical protein
LSVKSADANLTLLRSAIYISRDNGKSGLAVAFGSEPEEKLYDTFHCPSCGCQIAVQERKRIYIPCCEICEEDEE